jgi:dGTPase
VRDGIIRHSKGRGAIIAEGEERPATLEGQVVRASDVIAYISHDIDDAIRGGVISAADVPSECVRALGATHSARLNSMVRDIISTTLEQGRRLSLSPEVEAAMLRLRDFLYENVYENERVRADFIRARKVVEELYAHLMRSPDSARQAEAQGIGVERFVCDYIAGMTDRYAIREHRRLFAVGEIWLA